MEWSNTMENETYELGRYKKKVADQMKVEQKLREQITMQNMLIENAMLYIIHLGLQAAQELPCLYEVDYRELREQAAKYQIKYETIDQRGIRLYLAEKDMEQETNTETEK